MLVRLFDKMDALCDELGIFRVETIGDAYLCAANVLRPQPDHAARMARSLPQPRPPFFRTRLLGKGRLASRCRAWKAEPRPCLETASNSVVHTAAAPRSQLKLA